MKLFRRKDKSKGKDKFQPGVPVLGAGFGSGSAGVSTDFPDGSGGSWLFGSTPSGTIGQFRPMATPNSAYLLAHLPLQVLRRIFAFVCPHTQDKSYDTCEESAIEDACMLCDLRDLAHCVGVSKIWRKEARSQLYVFAVPGGWLLWLTL
jgi:hypothetical protein